MLLIINMPLTNNSYFNGAAGCPGDGEYNVLSNYVDSQLLAYPQACCMYSQPEMTAVLPALLIPPSFATIKSGFQTAKNVFTVGSMNYRDLWYWRRIESGTSS